MSQQRIEVLYKDILPMDVCTCGRAVTEPPHCKNCGSTNVYGLMSANVHLRLNPEQAEKMKLDPSLDKSSVVVIARGYRCRRCSTVCDESMPCEAPTKRDEQTRFKTKHQKAVEQSQREFAMTFPNCQSKADLVRVGELRLIQSRLAGKRMSKHDQEEWDYYRGKTTTRPEVTSEDETNPDLAWKKLLRLDSPEENTKLNAEVDEVVTRRSRQELEKQVKEKSPEGMRSNLTKDRMDEDDLSKL